MKNWRSDEYSQLKVSWFQGNDLSDYDDIIEQKTSAFKKSKIFGLVLNRK